MQSGAASLLDQLLQGVECVLDAFALVGLELVEPRREPGGALAADGPQHLCAFTCQEQADAAAVVRPPALDQFCRLEANKMAGHGRSRDALALGELGRGDSGVVLDLCKETDLAAGDTERVDLSPKLACESQQHRPKPVGCSDGIVNHANH